MIESTHPRRPARANRRTAVRSYTVVMTRGNESGFVAHVPSLPGCVTQGRTRLSARRNALEAIEAYVEALVEDGISVPIERNQDVFRIEVGKR